MKPMTNTMKPSPTLLLTLVLVALLAGAGPTNAQDPEERSAGEKPGNSLIGVWESVAPGAVDCVTREPFGAIIRAVYTIHQGGTMSEENTDPIEGPYRTSGFGVWNRLSGRSYTAAYGHYGFDPSSRQLNAIVKARAQIELSRDARSFTENGTFEVFFPDPVSGEPGQPVFSGCFAATSHRLTF